MLRFRNLTRRRWVLIGAALAPSVGCQAPKEPIVWTPKPGVGWSHVATQAVAEPHDSYQIVTTRQTTGLFPANMSVTRISLEPDKGQASVIQPGLYADPRNEFLQWNTAFDDQMAVSEVFPIDQRDLGGGQADPVQILAAFRALHARLGLIYAVNELSETESEMFGVLYDTEANEPLAAIHAQALSVSPPTEEPDKDKRVNMWETDSRALVRAKFERQVHACVRELIRKDQPALVETPTGWTPAGPVQPVEWPPRNPRTRR